MKAYNNYSKKNACLFGKHFMHKRRAKEKYMRQNMVLPPARESMVRQRKTDLEKALVILRLQALIRRKKIRSIRHILIWPLFRHLNGLQRKDPPSRMLR